MNAAYFNFTASICVLVFYVVMLAVCIVVANTLKTE